MANIKLTDTRKHNAVVKAENVGIPFEGSEIKSFKHAFLLQQFLRVG